MDPVKPAAPKLPFKRRPQRKISADNAATTIAADPATASDPLKMFRRTTSVMPGVVASLDARAKKAEMLREREAAEKRLHEEEDDDSNYGGPAQSSSSFGTPQCKRSSLEPRSPAKRIRRSPRDSDDNDTAMFSPEPVPVQQRISSERSSQSTPKSHGNAPAPDNVISLDSDSDSDSDRKPSAPARAPITPSPATPSSNKLAPIFDDPIDVDLPIDTEADPDLPIDAEADPDLLKYIERARQRYAASPAATPSNAATPTEKPPSLVVTFSSRIAGTSPIAGFLLPVDRGLDEVRVAWLDQQTQKGTPVAHPADLVFTWRGNEIYSATTLRSLNILRLPGPRLGVKGDESNPAGFTDDRRKVLLEVWTREVLERERERRQRASRLSSDDDNDDGNAGPTPNETRPDDTPAAASAQAAAPSPPTPLPAQTKLRLTLQTKDGTTAKLSATPDTQIVTLAQAFARSHAVPEGMRVQIRFDGLVLPDESTLEDTEVEDRDTLEVHFVPL